MIEPYYKDDDCILYCGKCEEILPQLNIKADLCLTDPPYGIGDIWKGGGWAQQSEYILGETEWDELNQVAVDYLLRLGVPTIIWGGNHYALPPMRGWLVWEKEGAGTEFTLGHGELAWSNLDIPIRFFKHPRHKGNGVNRPIHPTQKPLPLMKWCIGLADNPQTILDPFAGSGTTLVAAKLLKRKSIGIEMSEKYCEIIVNRLNKPMPLFDAVKQESLFLSIQQTEME